MKNLWVKISVPLRLCAIVKRRIVAAAKWGVAWGVLAGVLGAGCQSAPTPPHDAGEARFYVSPQGSDLNPGTKAKPLATMRQARDAVRAQRRGAPGLGMAARVILTDGRHVLAEPFVLAPQDSGVTYEAAPGAHPVVSGGVRIGGWRRLDDTLWVADVPGLAGRAEPFTQLFVNGVRRPCARTPDEGAYFYTKRLTLAAGDPGPCLGFTYNPQDALPWLGERGVRVALFHNWVNSYNRVQTIDPERRRVTFARPAGIFFLGPEVRYYVENSFEALDAPGEWYADREKGLLYYHPLPGERAGRIEAIAPSVTSSLIVVEGNPQDGAFVERLVFKGLSFQHTDANLAPDYPHSVQGAHTQRGAIFAKGLRASVIEDCTFARLGEHGVSLREGCASNTVRRCHFYDLGGGGVYLSEGSPAKTDGGYLTAHNTVDNNFIHDGGRIYRAACGVFLGGSASYNTITHNEICDLSWMGVHLGWSWTGRAPAYTHHNEVGYNHIHHIGNGVLNDIGGIYTLGVSPGTVLHHNHIHDVTRFERGREGYGGWGIYLDAGSSQITVENNVVHDTRDGGLHLHNHSHPWGDGVTNNIFAFSQGAELIRNATLDSEQRHVELARNIVYGPSPRPLGGIWKKDSNFTADGNLYWSTTTNAPTLAGRTFEAWQAEGHDRGGRVADPLFVDPAARDFRLRPASPALALGFVPVDVSAAGLYGAREWVRLPQTVRHRSRETAVAPPVSLALRHGFEEEQADDPPDFAQVFEENTQAVVRVVAAGVAGPGQCLRVTDGPGQKHVHNPHLCYQREFPDGRLRGAFDLRHETGAVFSHEWRDWPEGETYRPGPSLRVNADGSLVAGGKTLAVLPPGQWVAIEVVCNTGAAADGTWQLAVTLPGQPAQRFAGLPCGSAFKRLNWIGFISLATDTAVFYLDNVEVAPVE
jgi:hypothetical protein